MEVLIKLLRNVIGDLGVTTTYTDERLQSALATAAVIVYEEAPKYQEYTFDLTNDTISPDPTDSNNFDGVFTSLVVLKAACLINIGQFQSAVGAGIYVKDGSSTVDTTQSFDGYSDIIKNGPCKSYKDLLSKLNSNAIGSRGKAVIWNRCPKWKYNKLYEGTIVDAEYFFDQWRF